MRYRNDLPHDNDSELDIKLSMIDLIIVYLNRF